MNKVTQTYIKNFANRSDLNVINITYWPNDMLYTLKTKAILSEIAYSKGSNGINGLILYDLTAHNFYVITSRSSALFIML